MLNFWFRAVEKFYKEKVPTNPEKYPFPKSYEVAKEAESGIQNSLRSINRLTNRLNSVWDFKDLKDTFGGTTDRKLPFEAKRESVMSMQHCVKINQTEQPVMSDSGCDIGKVSLMHDPIIAIMTLTY